MLFFSFGSYLAGISVRRDQSVKTECEIFLAIEAPPLTPSARPQIPGPSPDGLLLVSSVLLHHPPVLLFAGGSTLPRLLGVPALRLDQLRGVFPLFLFYNKRIIY